jgi:hypothetical protein
VKLLLEIRSKTEGWSTLGRFSATPEELAQLHAIVSRHANPLDAIEHLPRGLLRDALQICQQDGLEVRATAVEE